jgi:hypothetical protein
MLSSSRTAPQDLALHRADRNSRPILVETQGTDNFKFRRAGIM